jgi:hypothetical protein
MGWKIERRRRRRTRNRFLFLRASDFVIMHQKVVPRVTKKKKTSRYIFLLYYISIFAGNKYQEINSTNRYI